MNECAQGDCVSWPITGDKQVCKFTLNSVRIENIQPALIGKVCNEKKKKTNRTKKPRKLHKVSGLCHMHRRLPVEVCAMLLHQHSNAQGTYVFFSHETIKHMLDRVSSPSHTHHHLLRILLMDVTCRHRRPLTPFTSVCVLKSTY